MGRTKWGKGSKLMAVADVTGLPAVISVGGASPHEVTLVEMTLNTLFLPQLPQRPISDRVYDSDPRDA